MVLGSLRIYINLIQNVSFFNLLKKCINDFTDKTNSCKKYETTAISENKALMHYIKLEMGFFLERLRSFNAINALDCLYLNFGRCNSKG